MLKPLLFAALFAGLPLAAIQPAFAQDAASTQTVAPEKASWYGAQVAVSGQDVVSFYSASGPVQGTQEFSATWDNTEWQFSSAENRDEFLADPIRYVPEFGGYCPVALAQGDLKVGTAEHFTIVNDELYLNYNQPTAKSFQENPIGYIAAAKVNF